MFSEVSEQQKELVLLRTDLELAREQIADLQQSLDSADRENERLIQDNLRLRIELDDKAK